MFTIEHEFDATVVTLIDEGHPTPLVEDITIRALDDRVEVEQLAEDGETLARITFSMRQLTELRAALNLPEGNYRLSASSDP